MHMPQQQLLSLLNCVSKVYLTLKKKRKKHNSKRAGRGKGGRLVCSFVIIMQQGLPNLFRKQSKMIFLLLHRISTQSQRMCTYAVGASCWAGGVERRGECWRTWLMPGACREQEKMWVTCFLLQWIFFFERKGFFSGQSEDGFKAFSILSFMCSHLCLRTVNKTEICMCDNLPTQAQVSSVRRCRERKERSQRRAGSPGGRCRVTPTPGPLKESSSSSRFQLRYFLPSRGVSQFARVGQRGI